MASSSIEWTEATWNPVTGCTRASDGCDLCYAVTMTRRLAAMGQTEKYGGLINPKKKHFNGIVRQHPASLAAPFDRWKSTLWFVNSMSDLFHKDVPFAFTAAVFGVMAATPQHQYQVLTKRPEIMRAFFGWLTEQAGSTPEALVHFCTTKARAFGLRHRRFAVPTVAAWPLPNVWLGTSVENDQVIQRVDELRAVPAQVRFLSCEPLIGELDLRGRLDGIHWVIVGGESGPKARPMKAEWALSIQEACRSQGVAYFFKQTGRVLAQEWGLGSTKGNHAEEWPEAYRSLGERSMPFRLVLAA